MSDYRAYSKRKPHDPLIAGLRQRRLDLWLTTDELAERLSVKGSRIWEFELGGHNPLLWTVRRFAEALDCDLVLVPRSEPPQVTDEMAGVKPRKGRDLQREALRLSEAGLSARVIAERLRISQRTVVRWRSSLRQHDVNRETSRETSDQGRTAA